MTSTFTAAAGLGRDEVLGIAVVVGVGRHTGAILASMPVRVTVIEGAPRHEADHFAVGIAQHLDQPQGICRQSLLWYQRRS